VTQNDNFYIWRCISYLGCKQPYTLQIRYVGFKHSESHPTDDKPSLKRAWSRHVAHFKFLVIMISGTA